MPMVESDLPLSWYPVALSRDVVGRPIPFRLFGGDYLIFRSGGGTLSIMSRYCAHMGADLARASVVGEGLRCGLHGWIYGPDGVCRHVPGSSVGTEARLKRLAANEAGGVVFAWPGPAPDWPFPEFPGMTSPRGARPLVTEFDCPMLAVALNGFDTWHYGIVHRRRVRQGSEIGRYADHHISLTFSADVIRGHFWDDLLIRMGRGRLDVHLDYYGGNIILVRNVHSNYLAMIALVPIDCSRCRAFIAVLMERAGGWAAHVRQSVQLGLFRTVASRFLMADVPFLAGMQPSDNMLIDGRDDAAREFWRWWRGLPRIGPRS